MASTCCLRYNYFFNVCFDFILQPLLTPIVKINKLYNSLCSYIYYFVDDTFASTLFIINPCYDFHANKFNQFEIVFRMS